MHEISLLICVNNFSQTETQRFSLNSLAHTWAKVYTAILDFIPE